MRGQFECNFFGFPPFGRHFDGFGHGHWHRGQWPHHFGMNFQEFGFGRPFGPPPPYGPHHQEHGCHEHDGPGPCGQSPGRHEPNGPDHQRRNFGPGPQWHGPHHHGSRGHSPGHHGPPGHSPDRRGPKHFGPARHCQGPHHHGSRGCSPGHHGPHEHSPDRRGTRHFGPGPHCHWPHQQGHGPVGPHRHQPFGHWGRPGPYDRPGRPARGCPPPRCCEDDCRPDHPKGRPCCPQNKDQNTDEDSGNDNERGQGRCRKGGGMRKNKPCCSKNKDGNVNGNETVLVQRIVVEKAPRCYSV